MSKWIRFFLVRPERFLLTLVGVGVIIYMVSPELFAQSLNNAVGIIMSALQPLLGPTLTLIIVFTGIKMILSGGKK